MMLKLSLEVLQKEGSFEEQPLTILTSFLILVILMPVMCDFFTRSFDTAFFKLENLLTQVTRTQL